MSDCRFGSGDVIYASDLPRLLSEDCVIEQGATIRLYYDDAERGDLVESGSGSVEKPVPQVVEHKKHHSPTKRSIMQETEGSSAIAPVATHATAPVPAQSVASTEQPVGLPLDVSSLVKATGGNGGIAVVIALIAVLFGAAGWKFWTKISEQHHELKMKELEMQAAASAGQSDKSPQQCATAHAAFEARIGAAEQRASSVEARLSQVEKSTLSLDADFDGADLKKRLEKIEKLLKAKRS